MISLNVEILLTLSVTQSCPTLCDPMDGSPPGSSVHGLLQARILEWVVISFSILTQRTPQSPYPAQTSPQTPDFYIYTQSFLLGYLIDSSNSIRCCCSVAQSCLTFCNPMDCSTPSSPVLHYLPEFAQTHVH